MKQVRKDLTVEGAATVPQVVEYLEELAQALRSGAVHLRHGDQELVLGPRGVVGFEVRARQRGKRQRLALEIRWRRKLLVPEPLELRFAGAPAAASAVEASADVVEAPATVIDTTASEAGEAHEGESIEPAEIYLARPGDKPAT